MAKFEVLDLVKKRMDLAKEEADSVFFQELLLHGEFLTKLIAIQLVASILPDKEKTQYKYEHRLVRANAVGVYASTIDEIIINYRDKLARDFIHNEIKELTFKSREGNWQYEAILLLNDLALNLGVELQSLPTKVSLNRWFSDFTTLRNKSKGHGAIKPSKLARYADLLNKSIKIIEENYYGISTRSWVYLYQNLSGKYRVSSITDNSSPFFFLKTTKEYKNKYNNGCYCYIDKPIPINLLSSSPELDDFFVPNGNYKKAKYEILSYITGTREQIKDDNYIHPVEQLPKSHTEGIGILEVQGESFGNLPPRPDIYINRKTIEAEINQQLRNYYMSPIITLLGKGGIGKTTTALNCLHELSKEEHFQFVLWFSSRDIDLLQEGPKVVKAKVFSIQDIANEYCHLLDLNIKSKKDKLSEFQNNLSKQNELGKTLFVFDNFETVDDPLEVYNWLYQFVRPPNKILITSRESRDFKGDYPIEIGSMTVKECEKLIKRYSKEINISDSLDEKDIDKLISESNGHPYIIKILLGEVAKKGSVTSIKRIVADRDDILTALFRRTYSTLSRAAIRVFLTLCSWRSMIPQIAIEAVLLRPENEEIIDVSDAIEELRKCSLIDVFKSDIDKSNFISVPLAASIFGKNELDIFSEKLAVLEDRKLLLQFGVTKENDVKNGLLPKVERKFTSISSKIDDISLKHKKQIADKKIKECLDKNLPILKYLCTKLPEGYKYLSDLYAELNYEKEVIQSTLRYIQSSPSDTEKRNSWRKLVKIYRRNDDWVSESHALTEICLTPGTQISEISNISDRIIKKIMSQKETNLEHKNLLFSEISEVFEDRIKESNNSTDYSRLAWINIHLKKKDKALKYAKEGIAINKHCSYCMKIISKIEN